MIIRKNALVAGVLTVAFMAAGLALSGLSVAAAPAGHTCGTECATCKAECQDSYAYCTSHPEECGHGSRECTSTELTIACTKKYGESCELQCEEQHKGAQMSPEQTCVVACENSFDTCGAEGHSDRACQQKYGESCRSGCQ